MTQPKQQKNLPNKLHRHLSQGSEEMRRHLGSESDWAKHLAPRKDGLSMMGDSEFE